MNFFSGVTNQGASPAILSDTAANRPAAALQPGLFFANLTTFAWERSNGTSYDSLGPTTTGFFANGGNSFGGNATLGTNDNFALLMWTNSTERMRIAANGQILMRRTTSSLGFLVEVGLDGNTSFLTLGTAGIRSDAFSADLFYYWQGSTNFVRTGYNGSRFTIDSKNNAPIFMTMNSSNALVVTVGGISTKQPSASGAGEYKLGKVIAGAVAFDVNRYVEQEIDGVIVKIAVAI